MCGIAGFFGNAFDESDIRNALSVLGHRGKDASSHVKTGNGFLGHNRLSIIDLSDKANQPFVTIDENHYFVYNGEIYNFKELKKEFSLITRTGSDTEVAAEMLARYGHKAISRFDGMFAFAMWDSKANSLLMARDHAGIKPLFYFHDGNNFAFASEIKALLVSGYIKSKLKISQHSAALFLRLGYIPEPFTIFENIKKFPAGTSAVFQNGNLTFNDSACTIPYEKQTENIDFDNAVIKMKWLLEESVKKRLISDVPAGIIFSGGIDSSIITAIAQKYSASSIKTFTIGFEFDEHDESQYAKTIAEYLNTEHYEYTVTEKEAKEFIPQIPEIYDEPYADSSAIPALTVFKHVSEQVKVTLSGDGGDELFGGYGAYRWAKRLHKIPAFAFPLIKTILQHTDNRGKRASLMFETIGQKDIHAHIFSVEQYLFSQKELMRIMPQTKAEPISAFIEQKFKGYSVTEQQMIFDFCLYLRDDLLVKIDRASMFHTVEDRVPFLSKELVRFAFALPDEYKTNGNYLKKIAKELLAEYLPRDLFEREKKGFSIPLKHWLKNDLRYLTEDFITADLLNDFGISGFDEIKKLKTKFIAGHDYLYNKLWVLSMLGLWYYNFKNKTK